MNSTAWQWIPALHVWKCAVLSCAVLLLGMVCAAEAGINVWTGGGKGFVDFVIAPGMPSTLYGSYSSFDTGWVYKSTDGGSAWDLILETDGPTAVLAAEQRITNSVYVFARPYGTTDDPHVSRSTDGGATWEAGPALHRGDDTVMWPPVLAIDPLTPSTIYAGTSIGTPRVFKSTDGGATLYTAIDGGVFSIQQVAAVCAGDCSGVQTVAITDVITLVNIALGTAEPATCAGGGLPLGGEVDVAVIIEAVNNALSGCKPVLV